MALNEDVIEAAVTFDWRDPYNQDPAVRADFEKSMRDLDALEAEKEEYLLAAGFDTSDSGSAYVRTMNEWTKARALQTVRDQVSFFRAHALLPFVLQYGRTDSRDFSAELEAAYRQLTEASVLAAYAAMMSSLHTLGLRTDIDFKALPHNLSAEPLPFLRPPNAPVANSKEEYEFARFFGDDALDALICSETFHIALALGGHDDKIDRIRADAIRRKWEIVETAEGKASKKVSEARQHYIPDALTLSTMKADSAGMWGLYGARSKMNYITCRTPRAYMTIQLNFEALAKDPALNDVVRALTPYDRRVFIAATSLQAEGLERATVAEIYTAMGYAGDPSQSARNAITESMEKMARTSIHFSNIAEVRSGLRYTNITTIAPDWDWVLPAHGIWIPTGRGRQARGYQFDRMPVLMAIAMDRKQITKLPTCLLRPAGRVSDDRLLIEDVLRDWIIAMRHKKVQKAEITVSKIFQRCGFENIKGERMRKKRGLKFAEEFLNMWQGQKQISWNWTEGMDGLKICIAFPGKTKPPDRVDASKAR